MTLAQEYLLRNNVEVPDHVLIKHVDNGSLFLRSDNGKTVSWTIIQIVFHPDSVHPGTYIFTMLRPIHNSAGRSSKTFEILDQKTLQWEEYEPFFYNWAKGENFRKLEKQKVIKDQDEIILTAWEMFVFCYDSYLAQHANMDDLCVSIDADLSFQQRMSAYKNFTYFLQNQNINLFEVWNRDMMSHVRKYCDWLAKITQ